MVGAARREQRACQLGVVPGAGELVDDLAVVVEAEPGEAVEDGIDGFRGRALAIGVLDAQPVAAAVVPGIEPVEQRGDRKSVVSGTRVSVRVDLGGSSIIKNKKTKRRPHNIT